MGKELNITATNFASETSKGIALVDFWAPCGSPCLMQGPIIEKIAATFAGKATVGKCNTDEERILASKFGIKSIPTLILFQNGKEIERFTGLQAEHTLTEKINNLLVQGS